MKHVPANRAESGLTFFVTAALLDRRPLFANPRHAELVIRVCDFYRNRTEIELYGFVVMPDHMHLIVKPLPPLTISGWMNRFKGAVAHEMGTTAIWQRGYWSEVIADEYHLRQKLTYLHDNPVRAQLVSRAEDYLWSSARDYLLQDNSARIDPYR